MLVTAHVAKNVNTIHIHRCWIIKR